MYSNDLTEIGCQYSFTGVQPVAIKDNSRFQILDSKVEQIDSNRTENPRACPPKSRRQCDEGGRWKDQARETGLF